MYEVVEEEEVGLARGACSLSYSECISIQCGSLYIAHDLM